MAFIDNLKSAWNAFFNKDPTTTYNNIGISSSVRPDRPYFSRGNEKTLSTSIYNKMALDVASMSFKHVRLDKNNRIIDDVDSGINSCLNDEANLDQTGKAFIQDLVMSMFDEGVVAAVPIDTTINPNNHSSFNIETIRTGRIVEWYPSHVRVEVYNERTGRKEELLFNKRAVAIIENPLYAVMNERNSNMQRLIRKLALLDAIDEQSGSGKLDLIIQLPYQIKSEARKQMAEDRRKDIEAQLSGSKFGIAYVDATEHITQLNRPIENNLMKQIEFLTKNVYDQLGLTDEIINGTAKDEVMTNYFNRTIEPIADAIVLEFRRKFLTKTARTQGQSIVYFRDPFKLISVTNIASIADTFTRNEIMTSNEIRQIIGMRPSNDPNADILRNKNLNQSQQKDSSNVKPGDGIEAESKSGDFFNKPLTTNNGA